jgi:hypothetical protein
LGVDRHGSPNARAARAIGVREPHLAREEVIAGKALPRKQAIFGGGMAFDLAGSEHVADGMAALGKDACESETMAIEWVALSAHQGEAPRGAFADDATKPAFEVIGHDRVPALIQAAAEFVAAKQISDSGLGQRAGERRPVKLGGVAR